MSTTASPSPPSTWSPTPAPVLLGAGWVLVGGVSYLVTTRPLVLFGALGAAALTATVAKGPEQPSSPSHASDDAEDASLPEVVIDLEARLALDTRRR